MNDAKRTYHRLKLKARRRVRKQKKHVEEVALQADNSIEKLVFKRIGRLRNVRRFATVWVVLLAFIGYGAV